MLACFLLPSNRTKRPLWAELYSEALRIPLRGIEGADLLLTFQQLLLILAFLQSCRTVQSKVNPARSKAL